MLDLARRLTRGALAVDWTEGVAESLPLPDASATVLWSLATVHHWPDLEGGLAEARRVLAPGGRFLVIERQARPGAKGLASHGWTGAQAEAFAAACRTAGFTEVTVETHKPGIVTQLAVRATNP
jgi:ubiquinone/menaquinone biosynthesis C-methylase UbiE